MIKSKITLEDVIEIAKRINPEYNTITEYKDAYAFYTYREEKQTGGDCGRVIMKKTGEILLPQDYFMDPKIKAVVLKKAIRF